jgi:hypothetical protein
MIKPARVRSLATIVAAACAIASPTYAVPSTIGQIALTATLVQLRVPGAACAADGQCKSYNCGPSLDIRQFCVDEAAHCAMEGTGGYKVRQRIRANNQCYECKQNMGWQLCSSGPDRGRGELYRSTEMRPGSALTRPSAWPRSAWLGPERASGTRAAR